MEKKVNPKWVQVTMRDKDGSRSSRGIEDLLFSGDYYNADITGGFEMETGRQFSRNEIEEMALELARKALEKARG